MINNRKHKLEEKSQEIDKLTKKFIKKGGKIKKLGNESNPIDHAKMLRTIKPK